MMSAKLLAVVLIGFALLISQIEAKKHKQSAVNNRPIVGILSQPTDGEMVNYGSSYIAASYVKYVESAGARVVPILHNSTFDELGNLFDSINAILFPGGGADLDDTQLFYAGQYLYNRAIQANDEGDFFPLFGHCMGYEFLAILSSQDVNILDNCTAENISMTLNFTEEAWSSNWLGDAPKEIMNILATEKVSLNNHQEGILTKTYQNTPLLKQFYRPISLNYDIYGNEFVSTWEGIKYPVFAMQWHAEKVQFEWNPTEDINHSYDAVISMQYFANFLANQARKNFHKFPTFEEEFNSLIYNYKPTYTEAFASDFEQAYIF
eukprot:TRINITY_DN1238_c0_g1_i1.p1 TRINITY_DN1238_c0_g1~~TRINITY_DN1238_c0_g1_i1.p1  ORF type:complete len:321 (+),score=78.97 TRINITY_DN1238_c0_g1_i1:113-1075(+)